MSQTEPMTRFTVVSGKHPGLRFLAGNLAEMFAEKSSVPVLVEGVKGIPITIEEFTLSKDGLSFELPAGQCPDSSLSPRFTWWSFDEGCAEIAVKFFRPADTSKGELLLNGSKIPIQWFELRSNPTVFDPILTLAIDASEESTLKLLKQIKPQVFSIISSQCRVTELDNMQIGEMVSVASGRTKVLMFSRVET